jgi:hypothetical protein
MTKSELEERVVLLEEDLEQSSDWIDHLEEQCADLLVEKSEAYVRGYLAGAAKALNNMTDLFTDAQEGALKEITG